MNSINTTQLLILLRQKKWQEPLYWNWSAAQNPIFLQEMLRDLTSRRATFLAQYEGQNSIVKVFYDKQGMRHARREMKGLELLRQCGVATSQVIQYASLENAILLVLSYLHHTKTLASEWASGDKARKKENLLFLLDQLARMYQQGVYHNDLHLNNILTDGKQLYIIDGMDVKCAKSPLSYNARLNNLADFFMQFSINDQTLLWMILKEKSLQFFPDHMAWMKLLQDKIAQKSVYQQRKMQQKVWRQCSAFVLGKLGVYDYVVNAKQQESFVTMFHRLTQKTTYFRPLTNNVFRYQENNCDWIVRQYSAATKAALGWENANRLQALHILTLKPIGILRKGKEISWQDNYYVTEYIPLQPLWDYLVFSCDLPEKQQRMVAQVVQTIQALRQNRLCYQDVQLEDFQVYEDKLYLLNLDKLRTFPRKLFFARAFNKATQQFLNIWRDSPVLQQTFMNAFKESNLL